MAPVFEAKQENETFVKAGLLYKRAYVIEIMVYRHCRHDVRLRPRVWPDGWKAIYLDIMTNITDSVSDMTDYELLEMM